jgi:GDP-4-dehydro-6-deoxy-D-mannose reductase
MGSSEPWLIVGGSGFVGSYVCRLASERNREVISTSRSGAHTDMALDITDVAAVNHVIATIAPGAVLLLAGNSSVAESWRQPAQTYAVNTLGCINVLAAIREHAPLTHAICVSSGEVYGAPDPQLLPLDESDPIAPISPYGGSKAALEIAAHEARRGAGLDIALMRPFNQIGPGQRPEFAVSSFACQIARAEKAGLGELNLVVGNLSARRDFSDVRDIAHAYFLALESRVVGTWVVASGRAISIQDLLGELIARTQVDVNVRQEAGLTRPIDAPELRGDPRAYSEQTGWRPKIPLERTLDDCLDWWRHQITVESTR